MSPRKQPRSLFNLCVKSCVSLINSTCFYIENKYPDEMFRNRKRDAYILKRHLMTMLPARLFDVLCSKRTRCQYHGDPRIQLFILTHPKMAVFRKSELDNSIPQFFWTSTLPKLNRLVVLDLKFICTDEILQVIGRNCLLLEEINIVSRVDICKSDVNASVWKRNVSNKGLRYIVNLKKLRILAMDPPRNERMCRVGRCVSQAGIIKLINVLPVLEELRIESCNIGSTLIDAAVNIGPLSLRKMNYHFASPEGLRKLIKICPFLKELSVVHFYERSNKDKIVEEITMSDLTLNYLDLSFFSYGDSMEQLLRSKGAYLTSFSIWEMEHSVTFDAIVTIGELCPNLQKFRLITQSKSLVFPRYFQRPKNIFNKLEYLTIGCENFNIDHMLTFFLECTDNLQKIMLKYQTKCNIDDILMNLLQKGFLRNIVYLWLDCTLTVSKTVVWQMIQMCEKLHNLTVDFEEYETELQQHIAENNLNLKLGSY
ncbi:hypothetical protein K1T71_011129 [Dendrolimus kikuchii]|uniref:Uncharacterized protein n=1 Tax=Dendrolimus kikuchii TaxID=765133 RepID=A0ACC1CMX6_9NEOP|nr:hypothetical protein K1T71_011129 [Dendrolimus kikuchii]